MNVNDGDSGCRREKCEDIENVRFVGTFGGDSRIENVRFVGTFGGDSRIENVRFVGTFGGDSRIKKVRIVGTLGGDSRIKKVRIVGIPGGDSRILDNTAKGLIPCKGSVRTQLVLVLMLTTGVILLLDELDVLGGELGLPLYVLMLTNGAILGLDDLDVLGGDLGLPLYVYVLMCVADSDNNLGVILNMEGSLSADVNSKYLFDLMNGASERANLWRMKDANDDVLRDAFEPFYARDLEDVKDDLFEGASQVARDMAQVGQELEEDIVATCWVDIKGDSNMDDSKTNKRLMSQERRTYDPGGQGWYKAWFSSIVLALLLTTGVILWLDIKVNCYDGWIVLDPSLDPTSVEVANDLFMGSINDAGSPIQSVKEPDVKQLSVIFDARKGIETDAMELNYPDFIRDYSSRGAVNKVHGFWEMYCGMRCFDKRQGVIREPEVKPDAQDELYAMQPLVFGILWNEVRGLDSSPRFASNVEMEGVNIHDLRKRHGIEAVDRFVRGKRGITSCASHIVELN
eukprot:1162122_1